MNNGNLFVLAVLLIFSPAAFAGDPSEVYPLAVCAVAGTDLGGKSETTYEHKGRQFKFCCGSCLKKFKADPSSYIPAVDKKIIAAQKSSYPLTSCVVSRESHEKANDMVYNNRLIRLCCKRCDKAFIKNPKSYLAKLDKAIIEKQTKDYPLTDCPVSGEPLGSMGKPVEMVVGNTLIKLCCKGCAKKVAKNPASMIKMVTNARASKKPKDGKKAS